MLGLFCFGAAPAQAEVRALLVGVGEYSSTLIPRLKGPANDLAAMEALVRAQGATDLTILRDKAATRTTVEKAIHDLGERSKPGDWVVIYFSGHGAQAQALVKGEEDDDRDEFLVLSGFDAEKPDAEQYIVDNDFYTWMKRYIPTTVEVLHIADACHSGTLNRSVDNRAWNFTPRLAMRDALPLPIRPGPQFPAINGEQAQTRSITIDQSDLPNVIFIGAAQDNQLALEASLPVEGAPSRGLLTYSFEQALTTTGADGKRLAADLDGDGQLSLSEMAAYLDSQTRTMTGQRQQPTAHFAPGAEVQALLKASIKRPAALTTKPAAPKVSVFAADARAQRLITGAAGWSVAPRADVADFVWDFPSGTVLRRSGDMVAQNVTSAQALKGVVDKWEAMEIVRPFMSEASMRVVVGPKINGARYQPGTQVEVGVTAKADGPKFLTVFNIASDGEVQLLYPLAEDGEGRMVGSGATQLLKTEVVAPFGADHIVAVGTSERPDAFRRTLTAMNGTRNSLQLASSIKDELAKKGSALSIGELYTGR